MMTQFKKSVSISSVSVILPCHGQATAPADAIESIMQQTYSLINQPLVEVIIVDDGSTHDLQTILDRYPQIIHLRQPCQGFAEACNQGAAASRGDYLVFLKPDDRLLPTALQIGIYSLDALSDCGFVAGLIKTSDASEPATETVQEMVEQSLGLSTFYSLLSGKGCDSARYMFRRTVFQQLSGFNVALATAAEYDFYLRAAVKFLECRHNLVIAESAKFPDRIEQTAQPMQDLRLHLQVLNQQKSLVQQNQDYSIAYRNGRSRWCQRYASALIQETIQFIRQKQFNHLLEVLYLLFRFYPQGLLTFAQTLKTTLLTTGSHSSWGIEPLDSV